MVQAFSYKLRWRFREQQSLWAMYVHAKYCSRSSPSEVSPSRRHNPVWRHMFQAGQKIQPLMRWVLGNGHICFWDDTWLEDVPLRKVGNRVTQDNSCVLVLDCWDGEEWDDVKLRELLAQRNCPMALLEKIRLTPFQKIKRDICRWTRTGNGNFSTSSAWQLARVHHPENNIYNQFWCKAVTPSMGVFLWRLVINRIPIDTKLQWRMLHMASKCRCCKKSAIETAEHMFISSEAARRLWNYFGKWMFVEAERMDDEGRTILRLRKWRNFFPGTSQLHISSVLPCLIMWFLWLERNDCTFQDTQFNVGYIKKRVELHLERLIISGIMTKEHWKGARHQHTLLVGRKTRRKYTKATRLDWLAPEGNWVKANTDAAYSSSNNKAG
ncbi:uncharacterized protein LOC121770464 [Salvia splendens]|uniref:uncharacterized protein LOC121770464 n=1 Tax=Salvia splendens TaxID=180675 RepID=UPI001C270BC6|nr:uncharacterized protein LOC121770464 [Salvia splendens]